MDYATSSCETNLFQVAKALEDAHEETEIEKDGDEELDKWEEEQIKKGASIPASQKDQTYGPATPAMEFEQHMVDPMFQNMIPYSGAYTYYGQGKQLFIGNRTRNIFGVYVR